MYSYSLGLPGGIFCPIWQPGAARVCLICSVTAWGCQGTQNGLCDSLGWQDGDFAFSASFLILNKIMLPGKTWTVLADQDDGYNVTLPLGFGEAQYRIIYGTPCIENEWEIFRARNCNYFNFMEDNVFSLTVHSRLPGLILNIHIAKFEWVSSLLQ